MCRFILPCTNKRDDQYIWPPPPLYSPLFCRWLTAFREDEYNAFFVVLCWLSRQVQKENYTTDAFGIHWKDIDEDLCFDGFFNKKKKEENELYAFFMAHPEINASAVARRLGMAQSLLAQYISGAKIPSEERLEMIKAEIREIGKELIAV